MRSLMIMIIVVGALFPVLAKQSYVVAKEENTAVYKNRFRQLYEQAAFTINPDERVRVVTRTGRHVRIENRYQQIGWVEEKRILPVAVGREFIYAPAAVEGYRDNPEPAIVWGNDDPDDYVIKLDRSFHDELRENVDKETASRVVDR